MATQAPVLARDDLERFPDVFAVSGEIEFRGPEQRIVGEAAADALLRRARDFADQIPTVSAKAFASIFSNV